MKKLIKRVGAIALAACMVMSMTVSVSAASYKLTLTFTGENKKGVEKTITATSGTLRESDSLAAAVYQLVASKTTSKQKETHIAHGSDGACGSSCGLYQLWSAELDVLFDAGKENYGSGQDAWTAWVDQFDQEGELAGWLKDLDVTVGDTIGQNLDEAYNMTYTAESGKVYELAVTAKKAAVGGGGGGSTPSTPSTPSDPTPSEPGTTPEAPKDVVVEVPETATPEAPVTLPVEEVKVGEDTKVVINTKSETPVKVEIPVAETTPGTVAVIIKADGTEQIIRDSVVTEKGVVTTVSNGDKIVIKDNTKTFSDVTDAHWGKSAVTFVAARGLFAGTGADTFSPDQTTNRAMVVQVLHNLEYNQAHTTDHTFHDVQDHHWYDNAVSWAAENKIVGGYGDGSFQGEKNVSREELVVMLWNYAGQKASKSNDHVDAFNDADKVSDWAKAAMNWALENGILGGKGGKMLDPTGMATRAEMAQMMKNFCENK